MRSMGRKPRRAPSPWKFPPGTTETECKYCGLIIRWAITLQGSQIPIGADGRVHFNTCRRTQAQKRRANGNK
jgi:hypothetical protein